jgi:hypothetical protein
VEDPLKLVSWFRFENNSLDSKQLDSARVVGPVSYTAGVSGQALQPMNGYFRVNDARTLTGEAFSIGVWVARTSASAEPDYIVALNPNGAVSTFELFIQENTLYFTAVTSGGLFNVAASSPKFSDGQFHFVMAVFSPSSMRLYIDSVEAASAPSNGTLVPDLGGLIGMFIGDYSDGSVDPSPTSSSQFNFSGVLDELKIFGKALSAGEVVQQFNLNRGLTTSDPQGTVAVLGGTAHFAVIATGAEGIAYQWQFNRTNIVGETNAVLMFRDLHARHIGKYRVMVTAGGRTITSAEADLSLVDLRLRPDRSREITVMGEAGDVFVVEFLAALTQPLNWVKIGEATLETTSRVFMDTRTVGQSGFYRVRPK